MAEETPFSPLDPLGPEYGRINAPRVDAQGLSPFEGDMLREPKINFPKPEDYFPVLPKIGNLDRPNRSIEQNVVRTPANNPSIRHNKTSIQNKANSINNYLNGVAQANQNKNSYSKIYSYNAGPDGNAFYKRYAAYGQETFDKIGFHPLRDNESNFNAQTSKFDDFSRMMTHSFGPLFGRGFVSGPKSLWKMAHGDFTSSDREDARAYEEAAAIGQSNKGGVFGFVNNTMMNFGYTAGIISEAIVEEVAGALLAAPTGGASLFATTADIATKVPKALTMTERIMNGYNAVKTSLKNFDSLQSARNFWNTVVSDKTVSAIGRGLNPLENTFEAFKAIKGTNNISDLAALSKTAGGFYRDIRKINMALSEARLEAGMIENKVYDKLYHEAYMANNEPPSNKEQAALEKQAKEASLETLLTNTALIYSSNAITFHNITGSRGGLRNFIKSTTDDVYHIAAREGEKNFGKLGKVVYDKAARKFELEKANFKNFIKGWRKNPIHKSVFSTVGYFKANFTEGIQENFQEVIAQANERYYIDSYKSPTLQTQLYSKGVIKSDLKPKSDYYAQGLSDQFSAVGAETFASGFFMGTLASPLNAAIPFLSSSYNKIFDKEGYAKWKKDQTDIVDKLVKDLNSVNMKDFMSDRVMNTGAQDLISKIRANASKKEGLDAETEAFVTGVGTMRRTGTSGLFTETLASFKQMDDKEFADAMKITEDQVPKYRSRIDKAIARINNINNIFDNAERKHPNPASLDNLGEPGSDEYLAKVALYKGWNTAIDNYAFFTEAYNDVKNRRSEIQTKYNADPNFQSLSSTEKDLLFNPEKISNEVEILKTQLDIEKDGANNPKKVSELENKINTLQEYANAHLAFDNFFNRADYAKVIKDELQKKTGKEPTAEEIAEELDNKFGSLDNEERKMFHLLNLRKAHDNYIKSLAKDKGDYVFEESLEKGFEKLVDYFKLGQEKQSLAQYVDIMNNPAEFMESARRNAEWIRKAYDRRVKYFEDLVVSEIGKVRDNALLNKLADNQLYLNKEDMENYLGDKNIPPSEIYDGKTKEIYKKGTPEYNEIYKEYFEKRAELKEQLNPKKTGIVKKTYQEQLDDLNTKMQEEIDALPTESVKEYEDDIKRKGKNKSVTVQEINEQLEPEEYVEVNYKDAIAPMIIYKDAEGNLRYESPEGEYLEISEVKTRFTEAKKFRYDQKPDEAKVKEIEDRYKARIEEVMEAYNADMQDIEAEVPFEEITPDTNLNTADLKDFRNMLYGEFVEKYLDTLPQEEQDAIYADETVMDAEFEKWYRSPKNKKYFDEYNKQNKPKPVPNNVIFSYEGSDIATKDLTLAEIVNYRDAINQKIANLDEVIEAESEFEGAEDIVAKRKKDRTALKTDVKNLNTVIQRRQFEGFPEPIKEAVLKVQKLIAAQKNVEEDYLLTEDDPVTGLKKGQKAYRVNGEIHRRTTNAIQDVLGKEYEYQGKAQVESAFNNTIGKNGLNENSINEFIDMLNALLASDNLPGTNDLFIQKLEDQLKSLNGLTPEQIKLEREKDGLLKSLDIKLAAIIKAEEDGLTERVEKLGIQRQEIEKQLLAIQEKIKAVEGTKAEVTEEEATAHNTTKDIIMNMFAEETYQDSRDAGNFLDDAKDYLESGVKPKFDESKISPEAYNNLFGPEGFLTGIKNKVDTGEFFLIGRGLVVYDSNIIKPDGTKDRIAGEIDLLIATKDGLMIVDIKSGESRKWRDFNKNSTDKSRNYSKREEYTLQQGAYATMLERMIDYPVAGTALLAIQRSSNKDTNAIVSAGKPEAMSVYFDMTFSKEKDGTYKRNSFGQLVGKTGNTRFSDWMTPLYRETVQDKLDILFPPQAVKFVPGAKDKMSKKFNSFLVDLQSITNEDTKENLKALDDIEKNILAFVKVNNVEIPDNIIEALNEKRTQLGKLVGAKLIDQVVAKYEAQADKSKTALDAQVKKLAEIKSNVSFDEIDLSDESDFIQEQLEADKEFKERFDKHAELEGRVSSPTIGQLVAAETLNQSGIISDTEYAAIENEGYNMGQVSELIHNAVNRIQYLKVTSESDTEANKFRNYQSQIMNLMVSSRINQSNVGIAAGLSLAKSKLAEGDVKAALDLVNAEKFKLESQIKYVKNDKTKQELQKKVDELDKVTEAIITTTGYVEEQFELPVEPEEVSKVMEIDYEDMLDKIILQKGMTLFSKGAKFTVTSINTNKKEVTIKDDNDRTFTITMDELNKNYSTEAEVLGEEVVPPVELTDQEKTFVKESQDNVTAILDDDKITNAFMNEADKTTSETAEDDLLDDLNCK